MRFALPRRPVPAGLCALLVLLAVGTALMISMRPVGAAGSGAPAEKFSAARAMTQLERISARPHPIGSEAHDEVRDYLRAEMTKLGLRTRLVEGTAVNAWNGSPFPAGRVSTLVAELPGTGGDGTVYLDAHYDSVRKNPGANDNGVNVAGLVEVARALTEGPKLKNDVAFVFTDAEEVGLLGIRHFLDTEKPDKDHSVVLNLEVRGASGPPVMFQTSTGNAGVIGHLAEVRQPLGFSLAAEVYRRLPNDSNFTEWSDDGFTGLNFAYLDSSPYYDSGADSLARVRPSTVQTYGAQNLTLVRSLGDADLGSLDQGSDTFFWLPFTLVAYPDWLVLPLLAAAVAGLAGGLYLVRVRIRSYLWALLSFLAPLVLAPLLALALWLVWVGARPEYGTFLLGDTYEPGWFRAALSVLGITVVSAWYLVFRRRLGPVPLLGAGLTWLALLGTVTAFAAPGASYLFTLPVLFTAGAGCLIAALKKPGWWPLAIGFGATVTAVLAVPIVALLYPALGVRLGLAPVLLIVLLAVPAVPLLELLVPKFPRLTTAVAGAVALSLFAVGLAVDPLDETRPKLTSLAYALDADTGKARWVSADPEPNDWSKAYVTTEREPMEPDLPPLTGPLFSDYLTGPAKAADLAAPELSVTQNEVSGDGRTVRLRLSSPRRAPVLWFHLADDGPRLVRASIDGREAPVDVDPWGPGGTWGWGFGFHNLPADGIEVVLTFAGTGTVQAKLIDQTDGLTGLPDYQAPPAGTKWSVAPSDSTYVTNEHGGGHGDGARCEKRVVEAGGEGSAAGLPGA
ncbi:M28 family peptidase, partial [Streptomyces sp. NPDC051940]|uniref:M28 family peptidase n=1 Tax=Streptomyces sp. NPDC051940 TaxID=3155675 RepID=UPI0034426F90